MYNYTCIGYETNHTNFNNQNYEIVRLYCVKRLTKNGSEGEKTLEPLICSRPKIKAETLDYLIGNDITVIYNKWGKIQEINLLEPLQ